MAEIIPSLRAANSGAGEDRLGLQFFLRAKTMSFFLPWVSDAPRETRGITHRDVHSCNVAGFYSKAHKNNSTVQFDFFFLAEISKQAKLFQLSVFALAKETQWLFSRHHSRRHKRRWRLTCHPVVKMLVLGVSDKIEVAPFAETEVTCALPCWDS